MLIQKIKKLKPNPSLKIAIGNDHHGLFLKQQLKK